MAGLPSQKFEGRLTFVVGFPRQGKTSSVLAEMPEPFLFACREVSNPTVKKLAWVPDTNSGLDYVREHPLKTMAIRCYWQNPRLLEVMRDHRRAYCLDEIANLFSDPGMKKDLLAYAKEVGYIDEGLQVWATTQRAGFDVWPGIYAAARRIKWVGVLFDPTTISLLYAHNTNPEMTRERMADILENLVPYKWNLKNVSASILTVKDI